MKAQKGISKTYRALTKDFLKGFQSISTESDYKDYFLIKHLQSTLKGIGGICGVRKRKYSLFSFKDPCQSNLARKVCIGLYPKALKMGMITFTDPRGGLECKIPWAPGLF